MFSSLLNTIKNNKTGVIYSFSAIFRGGITTIAGLLILSWIKPAEIGLWQSVYTLVAYVPLIQLGINNGLNRQLPLLIGKGENEKALQIAQTTYAYNLILIPLIAISTVVSIMILYAKGFNLEIILTSCSVGLIICGFLYQNYLTVTYRTSKSFASLSRVYLIESIIILFSLGLVKSLGYNGLILYYIITSYALTILLHKFRPIRRKPDFSFIGLGDLLKVGLPIYLISYFIGVSRTIPRLILIFMDTVIMVGLFAPAYAIQNMLLIIPKSLAQFIYPKMSHKYGREESLQSLWGLAWKSSIYPALLMLPVAFIGYFMLPFFINRFFPDYIAAIECAQWTLLSSIFAGSLISSNVFFSTSKYGPAIILGILRLFFYTIFPLIFYLKMESSLTGLGLGIFVASLSVFLVNQILLIVHFKYAE